MNEIEIKGFIKEMELVDYLRENGRFSHYLKELSVLINLRDYETLLVDAVPQEHWEEIIYRYSSLMTKLRDGDDEAYYVWKQFRDDEIGQIAYSIIENAYQSLVISKAQKASLRQAFSINDYYVQEVIRKAYHLASSKESFDVFKEDFIAKIGEDAIKDAFFEIKRLERVKGKLMFSVEGIDQPIEDLVMLYKA